MRAVKTAEHVVSFVHQMALRGASTFKHETLWNSLRVIYPYSGPAGSFNTM